MTHGVHTVGYPAGAMPPTYSTGYVPPPQTYPTGYAVPPGGVYTAGPVYPASNPPPPPGYPVGLPPSYSAGPSYPGMAPSGRPFADICINSCKYNYNYDVAYVNLSEKFILL